MKNDEFRKLVLDTSAGGSDGSPPSRAPASGALGGRKSNFAGMTPRPGKAPSNADFARQMRERHASLQPTKKFKSSAPKGSKFAAGYTDRARARQEAGDGEDDRWQRIKALEEQVKLGQLAQETFEALRDEITGGDASSTHLVKGLDRKLLERVRRGEDVLGLGGENSGDTPPDIDEELDKLEGQEVQARKREQTEKRGTKAAAPVAGVKRTRDEIMAELKAQRKAAAEAKAAAAPTFDSRWRKVGDKAKPKIEIDHKGREVLIIVDENGNVQKKVRRSDAQKERENETVNLELDANKPVLGADVAIPERLQHEQTAVDEDDDIFEGAGIDYNPLGDSDDDEDSDEDKEGQPAKAPEIAQPNATNDTGQESLAPPTLRSYFKDGPSTEDEPEKDRFKGIENVLKKAAQMDTTASPEDDANDRDETQEEREARLAKRRRMLAQQDRDLEDMDMGFGSSRFEDEEEADEGKKIRLSQWKGTAGDDDGWEEDDGGAGSKRKRKPKKRKGDVNNAADIMRVLEGRKSGGSK